MYLEKWSCKTSTLQMTGSSLRGTVSSIKVKSILLPTTGQRLHRHHWWSSLIFPTATALFNAVSEVSSHARPPEAFLHEGGGAVLALMCRLLVATIQSGAPMPLRNYKLEHGLIGLPLRGLLVQEAVLDQELLLHLM